jgi:hypothetical protein
MRTLAPKSKAIRPARPAGAAQASPPLSGRRCDIRSILQPQTEGVIQAKERFGFTPDVTPAVAARIDALSGTGQPLPESTRQFFEPRFGADFAQVRVHSQGDAADLAHSLQAKAFTVGRNLVFGSGQYAPETAEGKKLMAHELTHVVQQGGGGPLADAAGSPPSLTRSPDARVMKAGFESTIEVCHRVLTSRKFKVEKGGVRVVLLLDPLDKSVPNCGDFKFGVTLTKEVDWWGDDEIGTCEASTGGFRSFSFGNLDAGTYYLTIWRGFDHPYCCLAGDILVYDEPISSDSSGCERDKDPTALDVIHGALDIAGFVPALGAIPDGINAVIYAAEGDWVNAGVSAVAMVPLFGDGAKLAYKGGKEVIEASGKTVIKMGEEKLAKNLTDLAAGGKDLAAQGGKEVLGEAAEKTTKELAEKAEKEGAEAAQKAAKEAEEKARKEAAEKAEKEAKEKALKKKIAECEAIHATYKAGGACRGCTANDTPAERAAKIACITLVLEGRRRYLAEKCDYVLAGSIARGSATAEAGHITQVEQLAKMLAKCSTLPTK